MWRAMAFGLVLLVACGGSSTATSVDPTITVATEPPSTTAQPAGTTTTTPATVPTSTTAPSTTLPETTVTSVEGATVIAVVVEDGRLVSEVRQEVGLGDTVRLSVTADVADEVHLHGYDLTVDLTPGTPAELTFTADIPGIFEVELEGSGLLLVELVVNP